MKPIQAQSAPYQPVLDYFNRRLIENSLSDCMLSFSRRRPSAHTLYTAGQWQKKAGAATPELSLNLQQMGAGEPIEVMATLVLEIGAFVTGDAWATIHYFERKKGFCKYSTQKPDV